MDVNVKCEITLSAEAKETLIELVKSLERIADPIRATEQKIVDATPEPVIVGASPESMIKRLPMPSTKAPGKTRAQIAAEKKAAEAAAVEAEIAQAPDEQELEEAGLEDLFEAPQVPSGITLDALQKRAGDMLKASDNKTEFRKYFVKCLKAYGVEVLSDLPEAKYVEFLQKLNEAEA